MPAVIVENTQQTPAAMAASDDAAVDYRTEPSRYQHWKLAVDGRIARLVLDVAEDGGIRPGYQLKLNSYDLGVDIELADALNRIRFEHPQVAVVVLSSAKPRIFCSGANIFMLAASSHAWKVNFCKFTNETRNGIEDSSFHSGLKFVAACNGTTAGGGYELALACDEIVLVDDRSSAVSLPEVPLLGVLPGTGGLTRLTDKRRVRRDLADMFCTLSEGVRGPRALQWRLVDHLAKPHAFDEIVDERAHRLAAASGRPAEAAGVRLPALTRSESADGLRYRYVAVDLDHSAHRASLTLSTPEQPGPDGLEAIVDAGASWWPLQLARELDDAILWLRTNEPELGLWLLRSNGDAMTALAYDEALQQHREHWFVRETIGMLRRTLARLETSSRSLFALIEPGSCFAGTLLELALAADRSYMRNDEDMRNAVAVSEMNFGPLPLASGQSRLAARFYGDEELLAQVRDRLKGAINAPEAEALGLITAALDDLDWDEEIRIACEERTSLSPDALTGMEQNLRFGGAENLATRIFGRLSAWQNWIFNRPNAVGADGALKVFGTGRKASFDRRRV